MFIFQNGNQKVKTCYNLKSFMTLVTKGTKEFSRREVRDEGWMKRFGFRMDTGGRIGFKI